MPPLDGGGVCRIFVLLRSPTFATLRRISSSTSPEKSSAAEATDFALSYLVSSCGLSPAVAARAVDTGKVRFSSPENPDAIIRLLQSYGFTEAHVSRLLARIPRILTFDPDAIIKPKLEFFSSLGVGPRELCFSPGVLNFSLEQKLRPKVKSLVDAIGSAEAASKALKNWVRLLFYNIEERLLPNLEAMRQFGLPKSAIHLLVTRHTQALIRPNDQFVKELKALKEMGLNPRAKKYANRLAVLCRLRTSTWAHKLQVFRDMGWKDEETIEAFKRYPFMMGISEHKLKKMVNFFENELGWRKVVLQRHPYLMSLSLEKRLVPRRLVFDILRSKGLIKRRLSMNDVKMSEFDFLNRFVAKNVRKYPELVDGYKDLEEDKSGEVR